MSTSKILSRRFLSATCLRASESNSHPPKHSALPLPKLDIKAIVEQIESKEKNVLNRKYGAIAPPSSLRRICDLYGEHKTGVQRLGSLRNQKSKLSNAIRDMPSSDPTKKTTAEQAHHLKTEINELNARLSHLETEMNELASLLPNDTHPISPIGSEEDAVVLYHSSGRMGELPSATTGRDHVNITSRLQLADFEAGALVTGSSWAYLLNEAALLEQALIAFALATAIKHEFKAVSGPDVVRADIAQRCGFHPRETRSFADQAYTLGPKHEDLVLSGTAEIPLAGLYANTILDLSKGPLKLVAFGRAFRMEAGSRGRDTRGLYRLHQFSKVELFSLSTASDSERCMEAMLEVQKDIVQSLGIPFRILDMPTEELGASAYRKHDIEAWMPGRGGWGEICSLSNCTDYQTRRLHIRHKPHPPAAPHPLPFAHSLNGTAAAIPRLIIALFENGVRFEGDRVVGLDLPKCLVRHWVGDPRGNGETGIHWV